MKSLRPIKRIMLSLCLCVSVAKIFEKNQGDTMKVTDIKKVLIIGGGTMGQQIGSVCAIPWPRHGHL